MKEKNNKGGRPTKATINDKKAIVMNYYINVADGDASAFRRRDINIRLAEHAQSMGFNLKSYDFTRSEEIQGYIQSLIDKPSESSTQASAFKPLDVEYFFRDSVPLLKKRKALIDRENYFKNEHLRAAKALEAYKSLQDEIAALKAKVRALEQQLFSASGMTHENRKLKKENAFLKKMIREQITDVAALSIIKDAESGLKNPTDLMSPKDKEPAMRSYKEFRIGDNSKNIEDIKAIFNVKNEKK